ncbi:hypothetical protein NDU88_001353 [Pleurodeles waltl]|uniref:Uncharacterized protein n=1 Tax=Pleurodeles waltl TaxID=8319 RepID=A0AAV7UUI2_PLEWA|nr:hypothetical protein NDU88_001353 [Pleurodeles waltl]
MAAPGPDVIREAWLHGDVQTPILDCWLTETGAWAPLCSNRLCLVDLGLDALDALEPSAGALLYPQQFGRRRELAVF